MPRKSKRQRYKELLANQREYYSIGHAAELSGISSDTIRIWERRYGRPVPVRLDSGHRRYTVDQIRWLRQVAEALSRGYRPSKVVHLSPSEMMRLLEDTSTLSTPDANVERVIELALEQDSVKLRGFLSSAQVELGARRFLMELLGPTLERIGRAWADGEIHIRHEHFVSEIIDDELRRLRTSLSPNTEGPAICFASLSGELHGLGIQIAALCAVMSGARAHVLGIDVPIYEVDAAARDVGATAVGISVSLATGGVETDRHIAELRTRLPDSVRVIVGGHGARGVRRGPRDVEYVESLEAFEEVVRAMVRKTA